MADYIEYNCFSYIASIQSLQDRIAAIDMLIDNNITLIGTQIAGQSGGTQMYELDDGQIRIKVIYKSVQDIVNTNTALERMQQIYINRLNGRRVVMRDIGTFRGWGGGCC